MHVTSCLHLDFLGGCRSLGSILEWPLFSFLRLTESRNDFRSAKDGFKCLSWFCSLAFLTRQSGRDDVRARSKIIFPLSDTASLARFAGIPNTHALSISWFVRWWDVQIDQINRTSHPISTPPRPRRDDDPLPTRYSNDFSCIRKEVLTEFTSYIPWYWCWGVEGWGVK